LSSNSAPQGLNGDRDLDRQSRSPGPAENARATQSPAEQAAADVDRLIAAGILEDKAGLLSPTERTEATFGMCSIRRPGSSSSSETFFEG
jgi:hypothetical protein